MKYRVIVSFSDAQDNKFKYNVGDTFPRQGLEVDSTRLSELSGTSNKRGVPLIKAVKERKTKGQG